MAGPGPFPGLPGGRQRFGAWRRWASPQGKCHRGVPTTCEAPPVQTTCRRGRSLFSASDELWRAMQWRLILGIMAADISHQLARTLGDLAVQMQAQKGTADTLRAIVEAAPHI